MAMIDCRSARKWHRTALVTQSFTFCHCASFQFNSAIACLSPLIVLSGLQALPRVRGKPCVCGVCMRLTDCTPARIESNALEAKGLSALLPADASRAIPPHPAVLLLRTFVSRIDNKVLTCELPPYSVGAASCVTPPARISQISFWIALPSPAG